VLLELTDHGREELRRDRQVEGVVAAGAAHLVELLDRLAQLRERGVVVEVAGHEAEALGQLVPHLLAERGAGVLLDRVVHDLREVLVGPVTAREADQREPRRQQPPVRQVVDRRHQLLAGQVAGHAEDDQAAGPGDPRQPPVLRVAQRVDGAASSQQLPELAQPGRPVGQVQPQHRAGRGRRARRRRRPPGRR
jgi:hypothetical protein